MNILEWIEQRPRGRRGPRSEDKGGPTGWSRGMEGSVAEGAEQEARGGGVCGPPGATADPRVLLWVRCGHGRAWSR